MFPLIWFFNQRLNYRKFLTLDTKFSLKANTQSIDDISSPTEIMYILIENGIPAAMTHKIVNPRGFSVMGRTLMTKYGEVIYLPTKKNLTHKMRFQNLKFLLL